MSAKPINPAKPAQLHLKQFPTALRMEIDILCVRRGQQLRDLVPELLRLGIKGLKDRERVRQAAGEEVGEES